MGYPCAEQVDDFVDAPLAKPASLFEVSEGAYQLCIGISPPSNA